MNRMTNKMKGAGAIVVCAMMLWGAGQSQAGIEALRELVMVNPALAHLWSFEGEDDVTRRQDKKGTEHLLRSTGGAGTPATFVPAWGGDGLAAQTYRTDGSIGSAYRTENAFRPNSRGTVEYLFRPVASGGMMVSIGSNDRFYAGINDSIGGSVAFGTGTWPTMRRYFLTADTDPAYAFDHWFYVAVTYHVSGGSNEFSVFVADLDAQQTTLSRTLHAERTPQTQINSSRLGIGLQGQADNNYFPGNIDEVALYTEPLAPGTLQAHLNKLTGASVPSSGQKLLVADTRGHRVLQYSVTAAGVVDYDKVFADNTTGPEANRLHVPRSIAHIGNDIFISRANIDGYTPRILRYSTHGEFRAEIAAPADDPAVDAWTHLNGSMIAHDGALYIADTFGTDNIYKVTNPTGASPAVSVFIPRSGSYAGQTLNRPRGLAFGPNGNLFVGDRGNNRILEFQPDGSYVGIFNSGVTNAQDITWHDGKLYATLVGTSNRGRVEYWDEDGSHVGTAVTAATTESFYMELDFNPLSNDLFIAELSNDRVSQLVEGLSYLVTATGAQNFGAQPGSYANPYGLAFFEIPPQGTVLSIR